MPIDPAAITDAGALVAAVVLAAVAGALVARLLIRASSGASAHGPSQRGAGDERRRR